MRLPKSGAAVQIGAAFAHGRLVIERTGPRAARRLGSAKNSRLAKLFAAAYTSDRTRDIHYEIVSPFVPEMPVGCTQGPEGLEDARSENPDATFNAVKKAECRSCKGKD